MPFAALLVTALLVLAGACGSSDEGTPLGDECELIADCNAGQTCGDLVACVHGYCLRDEPSVHKPCGN